MMFFPNKGIIAMIGVCAVLTPAAYYIGHWRGYSDGKADVKIKTVEKIVTVRERQNEVRNHRPDDMQLDNVLRAGRF